LFFYEFTFFFFDMSTQKWVGEIRTRDLHFMRHDPLLIELPLEGYEFTCSVEYTKNLV
jgi:hypothetical protein